MILLNQNPYSYEDLKNDAYQLEKKYNGFIQNVTVGSSYDNRDILLLKVGNGPKQILCTGGVHGRESINPIVLMKVIELYAKNYLCYPEIKKRFSSELSFHKRDLERAHKDMMFSSFLYEFFNLNTILFVPLINPDGYEIAINGFESIRNDTLRELCKSKNVDANEWKFNARGIDINRNFPSKYWNKKLSISELEKETQALIKVFHKYVPKGYIDFHSRGNLIYYYRNAMGESYNEKQLWIAKELQRYTGYALMEPQFEVETGDSGGNTVHYFSECFRRPALTIETVEDAATFPLDMSYRQIVYNQIKYVMPGFGNLL